MTPPCVPKFSPSPCPTHYDERLATTTSADFRDSKNHHYVLVEVGWENGRRIYGTLLYIDIIDQRLWIQQDGKEEGIANEFVALGIPKQQIVLGFKPGDRRRVTEFAVS